MDHLLVNPNKIRTTGIPVSYDPFDSTRQLGIHNKLAFIPFQTDETAIYFKTHVPTMEERLEFIWLVMSGDTEWDPSSVRLQAIRTKEEEEYRAISQIARSPT